jgi:nitroreductase
MREQRWLFAVVEDREMMRRISDRVKASLAQPAPVDMGSADSSQLHGAFLAQLTDLDFNVFYDAPVLVVICAITPDAFVRADCWLAAENLMLAACALGLGTCCIGAAIETLNTPAVKADVGIPADVTAVVPIVVGVPAAATPAPPRNVPQILSWR